jgi:hypothetical protein
MENAGIPLRFVAVLLDAVIVFFRQESSLACCSAAAGPKTGNG